MDTPGWLARTAYLPGLMPSTGCAREKVLRREAVHNGRELSTLEITRTTLHVRLLASVWRRGARRPSEDGRGVQAGRDACVWRTARRRALYDSTMCSTTDEWLGRICQAIDELADTTADPGADTTNQPRADTGTGPSQPSADDAAAPVARLAAIWEMVADANPELAKRLPGYLSAAD